MQSNYSLGDSLSVKDLRAFELAQSRSSKSPKKYTSAIEDIRACRFFPCVVSVLLIGISYSVQALAQERGVTGSVHDKETGYFSPDLGVSQSDPRMGVIGRDQRSPVPDSTNYPYRTVGLLEMSTEGEHSRCTGTLIGERHVLTAAHCVYDEEVRSFSERMIFHPAHSDEDRPFGGYGVEEVYYYRNIRKQGSSTSGDIAVLRLAGAPGKQVGWKDVGVVAVEDSRVSKALAKIRRTRSSRRQNRELEALNNRYPESSLTLVSYPGDKGTGAWIQQCVYELLNARVARFYCDIQGGASGSALFDHIGIIRAVVSGSNWGDSATVARDGDVYGDFRDLENEAAGISDRDLKFIQAWTEGRVPRGSKSKRMPSVVNVKPVTVHSLCTEELWFAAHFNDPYSGWKSVGFWALSPDEEVTLFETNSDHYYFYAISKDESVKWEGDDFSDSLYGSEYSFRKREIANYDTLRLECRE